jgi:hypothetical protein
MAQQMFVPLEVVGMESHQYILSLRHGALKDKRRLFALLAGEPVEMPLPPPPPPPSQPRPPPPPPRGEIEDVGEREHGEIERKGGGKSSGKQIGEGRGR